MRNNVRKCVHQNLAVGLSCGVDKLCCVECGIAFVCSVAVLKDRAVWNVASRLWAQLRC